jgi:methylmalonyl-CoA/ethylmalonyl-CoA epimerase
MIRFAWDSIAIVLRLNLSGHDWVFDQSDVQKRKETIMVFDKIDRVAIAVRDLDEAVRFYSGLLGMEFDEPLVSDDVKVRAAFSFFGLELVEGTESNSFIDNIIRKKGEGVFAIIIKVTDMEKALQIFAEKGIRRTGTIEVGGLREVLFNPKDSYGIQLILAEYSSQHPATVAALRR